MKITIIGTGNVASHLAPALKIAGHDVISIRGRKLKPSSLDKETELYIIAVKDDAIKKVAKNIHHHSAIVVHTSGSAEMKVLKQCSSNYGVLYPLQTFSKERKLNFNNVPLCIEASNKKTTNILLSLARSTSKNVFQINSSQRKWLHLAAVFACNFTNHLYTISEKMLKKNNLSFDLLQPLILETAMKVIESSPKKMPARGRSPLGWQTGPAIRGDKEIMKKHLALLSKENQYRKIYKLISKGIQRAHE